MSTGLRDQDLLFQTKGNSVHIFNGFASFEHHEST